MRDKQDRFKRDLPAPPQQSEENYAAALAEVYRALDEAEMVAPDSGSRDFVDQIRERVRARMIEAIGEVSKDNNPDDEV